MKRFLHILMNMLPAALVLCACQGKLPQSEDPWMNVSGEGLWWKGADVLSLHENNIQSAYNAKHLEWRLSDDAWTNFMVLNLKESPIGNEEVTADLEWSTAKDYKKFSGLVFTVAKTSPEGLVWLWNSRNRIGITIFAEP